jgi:hypothetical protein
MRYKVSTCLDCGGAVNTEAARCPHCTSDYPHGVVCLVCDGTIQERAALRQASTQSRRLGYEYFRDCLGGDLHQYGYHPECVVKLFAIPSDLHCSDCGVNLGTRMPFESILDVVVKPPPRRAFKRGLLSDHVPCPNCGHPNVFRCLGGCLKCALPIWASLHDCFISGSADGDWQYWHYTMSNPEQLRTYNGGGSIICAGGRSPLSLTAVGFHEQCAPDYLTHCCGQVFEVSRYRSATHCSKCGRRLQKQLCAICQNVLLADDPETIVRRSGMLFRRTEYYHRECAQ